MIHRRVTVTKGEEVATNTVNGGVVNRLHRRTVKNGRSSALHPFVVSMCLLAIFILVMETNNGEPYMSAIEKANQSLTWARVPKSKYSPRMLRINNLLLPDKKKKKTVSRLHTKWDLPPRYRENEYWDDHGTKDLKMPDDLRTRKSCEYSTDWQFAYHPSCNSIHETDLNDLSSGEVTMVNNGAFRDVWRIREFDGAYRVMKTLRLIEKRKFDQRNFDRHRRDALAFEQLVGSPYVVDIFGHCSNSAVFDFCDGGDLFKLHIKESRDPETGMKFEEPVDPEDKPSTQKVLEVAIVVAKSVADAHNFDEKGRPTIAHTDIKPDQWILGSDGNYRLNDFNRGRFLSWDMETHEVCPFTVGKNPGMWRSPEEYNYEDQTEKGDVWSMGNVLYFLLTGEEPYLNMETTEEAIEWVKNGGRPEVTGEIATSKDPYQVAIMRAMDGCFIKDPKQRPGARRIADLLEKALHDAANGS